MDTFTRQRSDSELDSEWQPSGRRPQSTMAKHFSLALDDLFKMDNSIADLDAAVDEKKRIVSNHASELKALEERLKAAEERLKATAAGMTPVILARRPAEAAASIHERPKSGSKAGTARKAVGSPAAHSPLFGARPPTPGTSGSEDEK